MSTTLWRVISKTKWANVPKGIEVDIIIKNRSGKPKKAEISETIEKKYNFKQVSGFNDSVFNFEKI